MEEFDAKRAFENLAWKNEQLAEIVAQYMSEAGLERTARTVNALSLAEEISIRIMGGTPVPVGGSPDCCLIGRRFPNGTERWFCTGVLINPRVVLTAAHCHYPVDGTAQYLVALNTNGFNSNDFMNAEVIDVRSVTIHPDYRTSTGHDAAVLILQNASATKPVSIASTKEINASTQTRIVGFGNVDAASTFGFGTKREVEIPITHLRRKPSDNFNDAESSLGFESDFEFVAGGNGKDSCNGDSGGPAYIKVNGTHKLLGLTSRAFRNAVNPCGEGGIYTRVDKNMKFINSVLKTL
jgi:endonuclease G